MSSSQQAIGSGFAALRIDVDVGSCSVGWLEPEELALRLAEDAGRGTLVVVDVRTEAERADGRIAGSMHVPATAWDSLQEGGAAEEVEGGAAARALLESAIVEELVFHCMYSRERGPRSAQHAAVALGGRKRVSVLRGGFQQCMARLWHGTGCDEADGNAVLAGVKPERWVVHGQQGLVWLPDLDPFGELFASEAPASPLAAKAPA